MRLFSQSRLLITTTLVLVVVGSALSAGAQTDEFTVIVLPDPQFYSASYPQIFNAQTSWIAGHAQEMNIKLVLGVGDLVDSGSSIAQWQNADAAVRTLDDAGIPYFWAIGNNDYQVLSPRNATNFLAYFGAARYAGYSWFKGNDIGGSYPQGSTENYYGVVTIGGKEYLVLVLEFMPRDAALNWAAYLLSQPENANREVFLLTHSFLVPDNTRTDMCDSGYSSLGNSAEDMWYKFALGEPNISIVVNGHTSTAGRRADLGLNGNLVNQMLADYQTAANGGNGYLRVLKFQPQLNQIAVTTYSPYLNTYLTDAKNRFVVNYHSTGPLGSTSAILGHTMIGRVGSTQDCEVIAGATISAADAVALTNSAGDYSLQSLAPGTYSVTASRENFQTQTSSTIVWGGYNSQLEFFLVPEMGVLTGTVRDVNGRTLPSVTVAINGGFVHFSTKVKTNSLGQYMFTKISTGDYNVVASRADYISQTNTATVTTDATTVLDFVLPR